MFSTVPHEFPASIPTLLSPITSAFFISRFFTSPD